MKGWPFLAFIVAIACGGGKDQDLFEDPGSGGKGASAGKGGGGSTGGASTGGTGSGGKAGSGSGASGGKGGAAGGATGGTGGTGTGGSEMGGSGGSETGGTGGSETGGTGTGGSMAGGGGSDGGSAGMPTAGAGGSTGGAGTGGTGAGGAAHAGNGGAGSMTCEELEQAYATTMEEALACNPDIDSEQCTEHVPASIPCGCTVHVNPGNAAAVAELQRLQQQHAKAGCIAVCPAVECPGTEATCTSSDRGGEGRCREDGEK
jgi:hypothetical protein